MTTKTAHRLPSLQKFEKGFGQEMDGWMYNFSEPIQFICKKAVDGEIDFTLDPDSIEFKNLVLALANEFYADNEDGNDLEAIELGINAIALLASGDTEEIKNQHLNDFEEDDNGYQDLTINQIVNMFKGQPIKAAKAIANAQHKLWKRPLPYPHS